MSHAHRRRIRERVQAKIARKAWRRFVVTSAVTRILAFRDARTVNG